MSGEESVGFGDRSGPKGKQTFDHSRSRVVPGSAHTRQVERTPNRAIAPAKFRQSRRLPEQAGTGVGRKRPPDDHGSSAGVQIGAVAPCGRPACGRPACGRPPCGRRFSPVDRREGSPPTRDRSMQGASHKGRPSWAVRTNGFPAEIPWSSGASMVRSSSAGRGTWIRAPSRRGRERSATPAAHPPRATQIPGRNPRRQGTGRRPEP